jgi:hypothetical protein
MIDFRPMMAPSPASGPYQIHSEARGAHWVAWASREGGKPDRNIIVVGKTQEEAEANARRWADEASY